MTLRRSHLKSNRAPLSRQQATPLWLGLAGGLLARWFCGRVPPIRPDDLRRQDFPMSTQRLGVRFTERIRDTFRFRWIRSTP
jgi:hypothetical protein